MQFQISNCDVTGGKLSFIRDFFISARSTRHALSLDYKHVNRHTHIEAQLVLFHIYVYLTG